MKPLGIPSEINLYNEYRRIKECEPMVEALHETFVKFKIQKEHYATMGNIVLRFSHLMGEQDEGISISESDDENSNMIHFIADLYEDYNKRMEGKELSDMDTFTFIAEPGKHRIGRPE